MMASRYLILLGAVLLSIVPDFCFAELPPNYTFVHQATKAPIVSYYDYIIVGGGTAGCPLAATLSEKYKVLLLERGDSPYNNPNVTNLIFFGNNLIDTSPESPAQRFISEEGIVNVRPRVLGGGSAVNAGFYSRAEAEFVKDSKWDQKLVHESFEWVEKVVAFEPAVRQWESAFRNGLVEAGVDPYNGFTYDHKIGTKIGGSIGDQKGQRHTAADLLQYAKPTGLTVYLHASVHRILFRTKGKSKPTAHGVVFRDASGIKHKAYLNRGNGNEIILSAGALGSPQLLMLSGVGPKEELESLNIRVTLNQPLVGQGMADNPLNIVFVPSPNPVELSILEIVGITRWGSYIEGGSGGNLFGASLSDYSGFNPAMGGFIFAKVKGPLSKGYLELRNRNPNDNPAVTFNYFKNPKDLQICARGIRTILKVTQTKAFSNFTYHNVSTTMLLNITAKLPQNLPVHENTSKSPEQFCRDTLRTIWHYHGGCLQGRVVDYDYKVIGLDALRVIDGSTFHVSPGTNPQATVMMLGRYMGVKILSERTASNDRLKR